MPNQTLKQPDLTNVVTNGFATTKLTTTGTHYAFMLEFLTAAGAPVPVATIKSEITSITVRINGVAVLDELTPTFMFDRELYYGAVDGVSNQAGIIRHDWTRTNMDLASERSGYAIGTDGTSADGGVDDFAVEVKCGTLVQVAKIQCYVEASNEKRKIGKHVRIGRFAKDFASTGDLEITDLPKEGGRAAYTALHITEGSGAIDDVTITVGNQAVMQEVSNELNARNLLSYRRAPQSGYYHVDFSTFNTVGDWLSMKNVSDFRQTVNFGTTPNAFNIFAERIFGIDETNLG